jgi:hypothetical protein
MDEPIKGKVLMVLRHNVFICEEADGNRAWVEAHLREGDQVERDAVEAEVHGHIDNPYRIKSACVWVGDELVGIWTSSIVPGETVLSRGRWWGWETTTVADKVWRTFVRMTLPVFKALWTLEDAWVRHCYVLPWTGYEKTLRWQDRYFTQTALQTVTVGGLEHQLYQIFKPVED